MDAANITRVLIIIVLILTYVEGMFTLCYVYVLTDRLPHIPYQRLSCIQCSFMTDVHKRLTL